MKNVNTEILKEMLRKIITGDEGALADIHKLYYRPLVMEAFYLLDNMDEAKDVVQEVFIGLWARRSSLDPDKSLNQYLWCAVRNACIDVVRKKTVLQKRQERYFQGLSDSCIERPFEDMELRAGIDNAIHKLNPQNRKLYEYIFIDNKPHKEISVLLGIGVQTVKNNVSALMKRLRKQLHKQLK